MASKFKVLAGAHFVGDVKYSKGDTIVSPLPLTEMFIGKFEFVGEVEEAKPVAKVVTGLGDDVTGDFQPAAGDKYKVFRKGKNFFVTSVEDQTDALHEGTLVGNQVVAFIKSL